MKLLSVTFEVVISTASAIPWLVKSFLLTATAKNLQYSWYYHLSTILFFKGSVRYTHKLTGLNVYSIQNNLFLLVEHLTKKKSTLKGCFKHQKVVMNNSKWWENFCYGWKFYPLRVIFSTLLLIQSTVKQTRVCFNFIRMDISTLFVEKVDIATILLQNLISGGFLHQIGRYFHLMKIDLIRVEITTRFHQKPPLKQGGSEQKKIQCIKTI